jgi:hypothetical protein
MIERRRTLAGDVVGSTPWLAWQCVRLPLLLFLRIIEPVVSFILGSLALLGVLMTFFWWSVGPLHFPIALMLGISTGARVHNGRVPRAPPPTQ